jgi:hypothetical protein
MGAHSLQGDWHSSKDLYARVDGEKDEQIIKEVTNLAIIALADLAGDDLKYDYMNNALQVELMMW